MEDLYEMIESLNCMTNVRKSLYKVCNRATINSTERKTYTVRTRIIESR